MSAMLTPSCASVMEHHPLCPFLYTAILSTIRERNSVRMRKNRGSAVWKRCELLQRNNFHIFHVVEIRQIKPSKVACFVNHNFHVQNRICSSVEIENGVNIVDTVKNVEIKIRHFLLDPVSHLQTSLDYILEYIYWSLIGCHMVAI